MTDTIKRHEILVEALLDPKKWVNGGDRRLIETHISWVVLADDDAYKLKKPLDLGFLDFSSLEKRRLACLDEVRLNRRWRRRYIWARYRLPAVSKPQPSVVQGRRLNGLYTCNASIRMRYWPVFPAP